MSTDPQSPEVPAPDVPPSGVPPQPVDPQPVAHAPNPAPEPAAESPPEPPAPFWTSRHYVGRAFGFDWFGTYIEGSFHRLSDGAIDCDGLYGKVEYDSTSILLKLAAPNVEGLVEKVRSFLR